MKRLLRTLAVFAAAGLAAVTASSARADGEFVLRAGDRVVIYGDSITEQRLYSRYLEQYVACRYPSLGVRFFNAGWGGDTVPGATARLQRDVLELRPSVVTLFFGMNDGGYQRVNDKVVAAYRANLAALVAALKAKGVRVVVFGPGCCDGAKNPGLAACDYDGMLEALTGAAASVAKSEGCAFGDVFHPMRDFLAARRAADPAANIVPDGVHPGPDGHLVIARAMLGALGAEPMPPFGEIDVKTGRGAGLKVERSAADEVVLTTTGPVATPFWFDVSLARTMRESGFLEDLAGSRLTVKGLAQGRWEMTVDWADAGTFSSAELARGVPVPGSGSERGRAVHDLVARKEDNYFEAWRRVRLATGARWGAEALYAAMIGFDEGLAKTIDAVAAESVSATIRLAPAPVGPNLALHATYESSDPNRFGWGDGGLTDGSWESAPANCFATGNADRFPKTATVDLGAVSEIGLVRFGVPEFGSTRHVRVSVSRDGKDFDEVGSAEFVQRHRDRRTIRLAPVRARFVRLTYVDRWDEVVDYPSAFAFTTECEVYAAR